ncbi:MAG: MarR family transcriptional regulator [Ancalomicrobiaceae bacterium]|nr:MarR family transcriptional regulator [Ancalomicrobiaceae bacterium]
MPAHAPDKQAVACDGVTTLADLIGYQLRRASIFDLQGAAAALAPAEARPVLMSVLLSIVETPGMTSADICRALSMQRANIVPILADLEQRGLFRRETDAADRRIQRLYPTRRGTEEAARWLALVDEHEQRMLQRLGPTERRELRRLLELIWQGEIES